MILATLLAPLVEVLVMNISVIPPYKGVFCGGAHIVGCNSYAQDCVKLLCFLLPVHRNDPSIENFAELAEANLLGSPAHTCYLPDPFCPFSPGLASVHVTRPTNGFLNPALVEYHLAPSRICHRDAGFEHLSHNPFQGLVSGWHMRPGTKHLNNTRVI